MTARHDNTSLVNRWTTEALLLAWADRSVLPGVRTRVTMSSSEDLPQTFRGFRRSDGTVGIRNQLLIVPAVAAASTVARRIAALIPGAVAVPLMDDGPESKVARAL